jgi:hypothetical protein
MISSQDHLKQVTLTFKKKLQLCQDQSIMLLREQKENGF